ncbi:oligosaccharide flippase family protein [Vibrio sp. 1567]|uniref:lipopolysaccharide biosynthesis protein n=1 Tax=Vibrio sp. 1567 TaxID=3074564 RepID=UPI0029654669|nr:oligosaccharide flippase family protein [Vibrio sp. 1567]MDW2169817.1 oligosaccharide flippase family protein [Vibrio sp. 1567]
MQLFKGESSSVFKGMFVLLVGSGFARVLGILCIPILTRIYTPEEYGVLALYVSVVAVLSPVLSLRFSQALPLPKSDAMAVNLLCLCFISIGITTILSLIMLSIVGNVVFKAFSMEVLESWWGLVVFGAFGVAFFELVTLWATRKKQYRLISKAQLTQSLIGNAAKIVLGLLSFNFLGLILGHIMTQCSGVIGLIKLSYSDFKNNVSSISSYRIKFLSRYFREYVYFRLPSQFLMTLSVQAPVLMMAGLYGSEVTGQLSLAFMALTLPTTVLGNSISKAYYGEIASIGKNDVRKIKRITIEVQKKLFIIATPIALTIMLCSKFFFGFFFGKEWVMAGEFAALLAPFILMQFTSSPLVQVINILSSQFLFLVINVLRIAGLILIYYISRILNVDAYLLVVSISVYLSLFYLLVTIMINILINKLSTSEC